MPAPKDPAKIQAWKDKISAVHKGNSRASNAKGKHWKLSKPRSDEYRRKLSVANTGKKASLEARKKMSEAKRGEKSRLWKGGISSVNRRIRSSSTYRLWRNAVLERDGHKCIWCFSQEKLHADHIKPFAYFPELRFAIDNGRTLCKKCHATTDTYGAKIKAEYE